MPRVTKANQRLLKKLFAVKASPVHGRGLFARTDIPKGAYMGEYQGPVTRDINDTPFSFHVEFRSGRHEIRNGATILKYANHSGKTPNAAFDGFEMYARRLIRAGEEITFHYGFPIAVVRGDKQAPQPS